MNTSTFILWVIFCIVVIVLASSIRVETFTEYALAFPSKSYDGEKLVPDNWAWTAQPVKCFSCQQDMLSRFPNNPEMVYQASNTKCFSCQAPLPKM